MNEKLEKGSESVTGTERPGPTILRIWPYSKEWNISHHINTAQYAYRQYTLSPTATLHRTRNSQQKNFGKCNYCRSVPCWFKLSQMQHGSIQGTVEDQPQPHGNVNYHCQCTMNVNCFNVHNTTMEHCYNNITVTRSSFSLRVFFPCNLNHIAILLLETSTDYPSRLTVRMSFSTAAGLAISGILAIYLCGKERTLITSWFQRLIIIRQSY